MFFLQVRFLPWNRTLIKTNEKHFHHQRYKGNWIYRTALMTVCNTVDKFLEAFEVKIKLPLPHSFIVFTFFQKKGRVGMIKKGTFVRQKGTLLR